MSRSFSLNQLTEGIRERHLGADTSRLVSKWTRTGLLRGLNENKRENMARMLENQASQLLREANTLGSGGSANNIDGFSNIAFPIVRRVFGGLVANELVSIQPMSLPSGLLFYLDYTYGSDIHGEDAGAGNAADTSSANIYGKGDSLYGNPSGSSIRTGANAVGGMYDLAGSGYSLVHSSSNILADNDAALNDTFHVHNIASAWGAYNTAGTFTIGNSLEITNNKNLKLIQYDPQLIKEISEYSTSFSVGFFELGETIKSQFDRTNAKSWGLVQHLGAVTAIDTNLLSFDQDASGNAITDSSGNAYQDGTGVFNLRRLNQIGTWNASTKVWTPDVTGDHLLAVFRGAPADTTGRTAAVELQLVAPVLDQVSAEGGTGGVVTIPSFESGFSAGSTGNVAPIIPEIDIKIESIAVTAQTRKLRARWSPELAQDLNAYHSMDAEVELTQILSEQIALEIDREILNDLLVEAKGANYYWSRAPGKFVKKDTGAVASSTIGPNFTGTVREWYETLVETIIDVANEIHRKTLRGAANFIVVSPEVATIFEASVLYKPSIKIDGQGQTSAPFSIGAESIGSLSNRFTVYKDPYFPRNKILVGYKGGSYLESGYVYAPYVPLIVTPTIFAPEDFTPRKGVMTRYGKKMVRADFYGTVTCLDMDVI